MSIKRLSYLAKNHIWTISEAVKRPIKKPKVFFDIKINDQQPKRVIFELFADKAPLTVENFQRLCKGELKDANGSKLTCKDIKFDQVIPSLYALSGSINVGGFKTENFTVSHDKEGLLSLVQEGDSSRLLVTLGDLKWFDKKYSVFGKVVSGLEVFAEIEKQGSITGKVSKNVTIENSGQL